MSKKQIIEDLENIILKCNKCPRLREIAIYPMSHICYAEDYDKIDLFMIGRNPGLEDDYSNISDKDFKKKYHDNWLKCRIGRYLTKYLGEDIIKQRMFFTNVCKCSSPFNSNLTEIEKKNCFDYLINQIETIKPKFVIVFGRDAFTILSEKYKLKDIERFEKIEIFNSTYMIYLYHPSYFLYKGNDTLEKKQIDTFMSIRKSLDEK